MSEPYEDDMREMRRADALAQAVASFGQTGAPSTEKTLQRADAFYDWLSRKDRPSASVTPLAPIRPVAPRAFSKSEG